MLSYVLLFLTTVAVAYIVGLTIVNLVDKRLSNISIKVPKQNVTIKLDQPPNQEPDNAAPLTETFTPNDRPTNFADVAQEVTDINTPTGTDQFRDYKLRPDLFNQSSPPENVCCFNHLHKNCSYGSTNYPDPADMTLMERRAFASAYPTKMTLQDYVNWLWSNKRNPSLSKEHMTNLDKLKKNVPLKYEAGKTPPPPPQKLTTPQKVSEHFENLYKGGFDFKNTDNEATAEFAASNYENYDTQSAAENLGTPYEPTCPPKKFNAHTLFKMTTPQIRPDSYVHVSPAAQAGNPNIV